MNLPLPITNPKENLETISRYKLSLLFDPALFEVRQEIQRDKGIDLVVELKQDNAHTNFRFAIQLKSTASVKLHKNDTTSYPVHVANINYLLNYGMPAYYVLYDHSGDNFYVEQAHKVFQSLTKKYSPEKLPKQFNVNFSKHLTIETIKSIYQETLENGLLLRRLNTHLNLSSAITKQPIGIVIDSDSDVYNSVEQNIEFIEHFGLVLINQSDFKRIIEIEQRTHPRTTASPMFNLVCGIAYFQQASLFKAIDFLKTANIAAATFDPPVRSMLKYTFLQAKHLLGLIGHAEFKEGIAELMQTEQLGSFLELEKAHTAFVEGTAPVSTRINALQNKIVSFLESEPDNIHLRIRAYSIILQIEQKQLLHNLPLNFVTLCGRVPALLNTNTYTEWKELDEKHSNRLQSLLKYCLDTQNFLASSNIAMDISDWVYQKLFIIYVLKNWSSKSQTVKGKISSEELNLLAIETDKLDKVVEGYEMLEHRENIVYALSLKYEMLNFAGRIADADKTGAQMELLIEKHEMNSLKSNYKSLINGETRYKQFTTSFTQHMDAIYRFAENNGLKKYFTQPIPSKYMKDPVFFGKENKWLEGEFFELNFPAIIDQHT